MKVKPQIIISTFDDIENPYSAGSLARSIHKISEHLRDKYRITIITSKFPGSVDMIKDNVQYKRIGIFTPSTLINKLVYQIMLPFNMLQGDFDVWVEAFTFPCFFSMLPFLTKKPVIAFLQSELFSGIETQGGKLSKKIGNFGLKYYHDFIVVNQIIKRRIRKLNKNSHVWVIPNGVDFPKSKLNKRGRHILYLGRIEMKMKGLDLLLKSYKNIENRIHQPLVIAGPGTKKEILRLKNEILRKNLSRKVKLVGKVEEKEKEKLFKNASVVAVPSRFDTFSSISLEALSYGLPVVCFDISGLKWLPNNLAVKVKKYDEERYASALFASLHTKKRGRIRDFTKRFLKLYSWENILKQYEDVLQGVLTESGYSLNIA